MRLCLVCVFNTTCWGHSGALAPGKWRVRCHSCAKRRLWTNLYIYLPRPFSRPCLSARGLCSSSDFYRPSYQPQLQLATHTLRGAERRVFVFAGGTVRSPEASGIPPSALHSEKGGGGRNGWRDDVENAIGMNIHRAWATSCTAY